MRENKMKNIGRLLILSGIMTMLLAIPFSSTSKIRKNNI